MTKDAGSDIVLTRIFGRFAKDSSFFKKKYDITIGRDVDNDFTVCDSTLDYMHDFLQTRRDDLGGGSSDLNEFCDQLMEDIARYIEMQARRGGYPYNHHSTFCLRDEDGVLRAVLKLSSDPGYKGNYDPENNKEHRGPFVGRPEQYKPMPY